MASKIPELHDTDDEIVCPLCHGDGKITGKAVFRFMNGLLALISDMELQIKIELHKGIMRRLWNVGKESR